MARKPRQRNGGAVPIKARPTPDPSPPRAARAGGGEKPPLAPKPAAHAALYRLMAWLSPAFPVGAFSYSSGIEWAVEAGDITNAETLKEWLSVTLTHGAAFCDAVFFVHAHKACQDDKALRAVAELAAAFASSKERHLETTAQGRAFIEATRAAWPCDAIERLLNVWDGPVAYPDCSCCRERRSWRRAGECAARIYSGTGRQHDLGGRQTYSARADGRLARAGCA